jgi:hypothetical protein
MTAYNFTVDLNQPCTSCGNNGRVIENEAGLCLTCINAALGASVRSMSPATSGAPARGLSHYLAVLIDRAMRARDQKFHSLPLPHGLYVELGPARATLLEGAWKQLRF